MSKVKELEAKFWLCKFNVYSLSVWSDKLRLKLVNTHWFICLFIKTCPVGSVELDRLFAVGMTELGAAFFAYRSETVARIEVNELHAPALKGGYRLEILILVGIGCDWILNVFDVAYSFTEFALGDEVCLAFAARNVLKLGQFEVDLLITDFVAVSAFGGKVPVLVGR